MSDSPKYPKFVWIIGTVVLVVIVGYVLLSRQPVEEIEFPGGRAKFGPTPKDETVSFFISYSRDKHVIKGDAVVYLAGSGGVNLHVDRQYPFHTATITVPKPGRYAYHIEQKQVSSVYPANDLTTQVPVTYQMSGEGKIDVQPGAAFLVTPVIVLQDGGRPAKWISRLETIRSEEEQRRMEEEAIIALDEELGLK